MKSNWNTPQLVMLVRGKPEETVLLSCKSGTPEAGLAAPANGTPKGVFNGCYYSPLGPAPLATGCSACENLSLS